ncbi:hypothetical protein LY71_101499 [Geodermatophilus tzadiensis]|uniref:DUF5667 domain-containing protein n=1 Tax=Geodermatophilus tzadiensis TaxID=1137988 RepID=A0A2T0U2H7_9ACTN|nr:DUF5667 domain-containing protein [Geodermatophilus tzadiensis]PRY52122.1 hypothetical protein LY71_101499 [Geodermatophilus tzadiensis]
MNPSHDAAGSRRASVRDREEALETRLRALAADLDTGPAPDFRAATRARLVAMAAVRPRGPVPRRGLRALLGPRRAARRSRLTAAVAGAALAATATGALVALSADARPGDALYGLKRGTEQTELALAGDERGPTLLELASTRLQELDGLVDGGAPAPVVRDTLATMDAQTTEGAALVSTAALDARDAAPLSALGDWARQQGAGLADLRPTLPGGAATDSIDLVGRIGARAQRLRTALACPAGPAISGRDELGPVPAPCAAPEAPVPTTPSAVPADPGTPTGDSPAGEVSPAAPPPGPAAPSGGSSGGAAGSGPAPDGSAPTGSAPAPSTTTPDGGPVPSLPVPGGGGTAPSPSPTSTPPPVLDTPLPTCLLPPVLC